jgi:hypothetical protein
MVPGRMLADVLILYKICWRNFDFSNYVERMNKQTNTLLWLFLTECCQMYSYHKKYVGHNGNFEFVKLVTVMLQGDPIHIFKSWFVSELDKELIFHQFDILIDFMPVLWTVTWRRQLWLKAQLDGAWLGSFCVITDVTDRIVFKRAMYPAWCGLWLGKRGSDRRKSSFFTILKGTAWAAVVATQGLQSVCQASLIQICIHLGLIFVFCCRGARRVNELLHQHHDPCWRLGRRRTTRLHNALFHKLSRTYPSHLLSWAASCSQIVFCSDPLAKQVTSCHLTSRTPSRWALRAAVLAC